MLSGEARVSGLLSAITQNSVDASRVAQLKYYKKLVTLIESKKPSGSKTSDSETSSDTKTSESSALETKTSETLKSKHVSDTSNSRSYSLLSWLLWISLIYSVYLVYQHQLLTHEGFSRFWLNWENIDLHAEQCTIDMPDTVQDVFRPTVDCSMCRNVNAVDRVSDLSPQMFEQKYAYSGRPVLILDGQSNWTAPEIFTFDFFKNIYSSDSPVLVNSERDCQFFPYQTSFSNLGQVFNMSEERSGMKGEPWYIGWSNCDSTAANTIRSHYSRPYFLPLVSESSKTDWIFMGTPGYGAHLHIDHVGKPSWQAQIRGSKKWTLVPPPECYFQCKAMSVTVNPGNIIVLDTNMWYHKTLIVSDDLSITIGSEYD